MPIGQLKINGEDAFEKWGMSLSHQGLSALMTPPPVKAYVTNKTRVEHGTRVASTDTKVDERVISVPFHITAPNETVFFRRYRELMAVLASGVVEIWTSLNPKECYRCLYQSCTQFGEYQREMAKFTLKLYEPDPTDRSVDKSKYPYFELDTDNLDNDNNRLT